VKYDLDMLENRIDALYATPPGDPLEEDAEAVVEDLLARLEAGEIRSAVRGQDGRWSAVPWVKRGILVAFRAGRVIGLGPGGVPTARPDAPSPLLDKHTLPVRHFRPDERVRIVPGGSSVRRGAYIAPGVVCMPPMFINVGTWIGQGTMIDSHALVGSCAQVGAHVHLSAAAQIGGVLEPINANPVVVEDDVVVGGNAGVYEGTIVRRGAVLGAGVVLTRATPVYDLVRERVIRSGPDAPLEIPEDAVVVAGSRAVRSEWGSAQGLSIYTPVIVKYRDEKTDLATALEQHLR